MGTKKERASDIPTKQELYYFSGVKIRCHMEVAKEIRIKLRPGSARTELFRGTCFGPWLDVRSTSNGAPLVHLILQTEYTPVVHQDALFFRVGGQELRFGPQEFCLITGLRFGPDHQNQGRTDLTFRERVFGHVQAKLKVSDLKNVFDCSLDQLSDLDAVRLCLLILLEIGFMGRDPNLLVDSILLELVEDLNLWNTFPWGSYVWKVVYNQLHNALAKRSARLDYMPLSTYSLSGFIWAFKIWIFEVFPYAKRFATKHGGIPRAIGWGKNRCITWKLALPFVMKAMVPGLEPLPVLTPTPAECATDWWRSSRQFFDSCANDSSPHPSVMELRRSRRTHHVKTEMPTTPDLFGPFDHVEDHVVVGKDSSQSDTICFQGYKVKQSVAPILESIFKKHGDIAADCIFKPASMRSSFLEIVCEVVSRIQTNDNIGKMEEIEQQVVALEAANINVSWLRVHLEATHKRKKASLKRRKCSFLTEMKANMVLVKIAAQMDLRERCAELMDAQEQFEKAEKCVRVLHLVDKYLNDNM